jgi:hypothetical protein
MRMYTIAVAAAALFAFPPSAFSQAVVVIGPKGGDAWVVREGRSVWRPGCRELRRACLSEEELGEQGQGDCEGYRETCKDQ